MRAINLRLDTSDPARPRLVRHPPGQPALLIFGFPPQSIVERAYFETAAIAPPPFNPPPSNPPLEAPPPLPNVGDVPQPPGATAVRMSGESRLVFRLPNNLHELPYSISGLLDWSRLSPVLPDAAAVPPGEANAPGQSPPSITEPGDQVTAIELPYRLLIAPNVSDGGEPTWVHATEAVEHEGRVELWHTRLARRRNLTREIPRW